VIVSSSFDPVECKCACVHRKAKGILFHVKIDSFYLPNDVMSMVTMMIMREWKGGCDFLLGNQIIHEDMVCICFRHIQLPLSLVLAKIEKTSAKIQK